MNAQSTKIAAQTARVSRSVSALFPTLLATLLLSGCATLDSLNPFSSSSDVSDKGAADQAKSDESTTATADASVVKSDASTPAAIPQPATSAKNSVELRWQVPNEPVESYHLKYGYDTSKLDTEKSIGIQELKKVDDPAHGPVFVYQIDNIKTDRTLYFSLRAENKKGLSEPSSLVKLENGQFSMVGSGSSAN